ncbi:MAG: RsmE family RNA methyltransferase [bacterium]
MVKNKLIINNFEFKHLTKVLRKRAGDSLTVTDGERNIYQCKIIFVNKNEILCDIFSKEFNLYEAKTEVTLYLSPLKNSSRFEFAVEKAVELGVVSIKPVSTEHTFNINEFSRSKIERINKIIIGAMGQSQRCFLPEFHNLITFKDMLNYEKEKKNNKIVMYEFSDNISDHNFDGYENKVSLLIGPEGGFADEEIDLLKKNKWEIKSLGARKLRAETAAVVSVFDILSKFK